MKYSITFVLTFFLLILSSYSSAQTTVKTQTSEGSGATRDLAITNAIKNAIVQVNGAKIKSKTLVEAAKTGIKVDDGVTEKSVSFEFENSSSTDLQAAGIIKSYQIIDVHKNGNEWHALLDVDVYDYQIDISSNRKKVALLPTENRYSNTQHGKKVAEDLTDSIENELVQSRRFAVLSRTDISKVINEQKIIDTSLTQASEKAKLGNLLGGDVLLYPIINKAYYTVRRETIQVTGQIRETYEGHVDITLKVISAVTGEIKFSNKYTASSNSKSNNLSSLIKLAAHKSIKDLVKRIYPTMIVQVNSNQVYLNDGGLSVREGEVFSIYRLGETIIDPYTKESLGSDEHFVGKIRITRVESKFSIGEMLEGTTFEAGMIARSDSVPAARYTQQPTAHPVKKPASGYKLPYD